MRNALSKEPRQKKGHNVQTLKMFCCWCLPLTKSPHTTTNRGRGDMRLMALIALCNMMSSSFHSLSWLIIPYHGVRNSQQPRLHCDEIKPRHCHTQVDMHFRLGVVQLLLARLDSTVSETAFISNRSGPSNLAPNQKMRVKMKNQPQR
jgi:hypothetical protein